jgi:hypothetical protein
MSAPGFLFYLNINRVTLSLHLMEANQRKEVFIKNGNFRVSEAIVEPTLSLCQNGM